MINRKNIIKAIIFRAMENQPNADTNLDAFIYEQQLPY